MYVPTKPASQYQLTTPQNHQTIQQKRLNHRIGNFNYHLATGHQQVKYHSATQHQQITPQNQQGIRQNWIKPASKHRLTTPEIHQTVYTKSKSLTQQNQKTLQYNQRVKYQFNKICSKSTIQSNMVTQHKPTVPENQVNQKRNQKQYFPEN